MSTIVRFSLSEYDRMIAQGVFDLDRRERLEFIRGEIREMSPIGPEHEDIVDWLNEWSARLQLPGVRIRVQESVGLPPLASAPEPDLAWVVRRSYRRARPTAADVLLLVEVAESTLCDDLGEKADLYAEAGIADYWVVNIPDRCIVVHRDPQGGRYREIRAHAGDEELRPLAFRDVVLRPASLWEAEETQG